MNKWILALVSLVIFSTMGFGQKKQKDRKEEISIEKTACFGKCPVFKMVVYKDGYVVYEGIRFSDKMGKWAKKIKSKDRKALCKAFRDANLDQYQDNYPSELVDLATTRLSFTYKENIKKISGKNNLPEAVNKLSQMLMDLANTPGWDQIEKSKFKSPHPPMDLVKNELLVHFEKEVNVAKWIQQYADQELSTVKKLSANAPYWLLKFNDSNIGPDAMIQLLLADEQIINVEFNRKVDIRED